MTKQFRRKGSVAFLIGALIAGTPLLADACTRIFWNANPELMIVGRNEDYVTASHPTLVATPRGIERVGTPTNANKAGAISWTVKYANVASYANNRFPNDGMNEAGLTARTLFYLEGASNEVVAPDSKKKELDEDHWVSYILDNFATVADAVEAFKTEVYVVSVTGKKGSGYSYATPKHLAMADATGDSAILEIQDGKLKIFHGSEYRILTNPPSYQDELKNSAKYADVAQQDMPGSWSAADRFVRADYHRKNLPNPLNNDPQTGYGFMYSALASEVMPAGLPNPPEDDKLIKQLIAALKDPTESYGSSTYFQSISDLTNKHYRFRSLIAASDVYFTFSEHDLSNGQPVRIIKRIDQYAQQGWDGNVKAHLVEIDGDIYDQSIE